MSGRLPNLVPMDFDLERIAERARRRDEFAKAALTGLLANSTRRGTYEAFGIDAANYADATLAALDATASVQPSPATRPGEVE